MEKDMKDLNAEEVREILWGDNDDYVTVVGKTLLDRGRWWVSYEQIVQCKPDGTYWSIVWQSGATESQDCDFEPEVAEVKPVQVTVTKYMPKDA